MIDWFKSGGWGMFPILAVGVFAAVVGLRAMQEPTKRRLALLSGMPMLLLVMGIFSCGTGLWAVNLGVSHAIETHAFAGDEGRLPLIALIGITEAAQNVTLAGIFATIAAGLRAIAEWRADHG